MLGARIAALRKGAGINQAALAKRLHVSASAVGMYEQGRREPSAACIVALAELFHVSTDYLLTGVPQAQDDVRAVRQLLERLKNTDSKPVSVKLSDGTVVPLQDRDLALIFSALLE